MKRNPRERGAVSKDYGIVSKIMYKDSFKGRDWGIGVLGFLLNECSVRNVDIPIPTYTTMCTWTIRVNWK